MGRKKQELTMEQQEERRKRWWGPQRNERRRQQYRSDPDYRDKVQQQARETYRNTHGVEPEPNCRTNLPVLAGFGQMRTVEEAGQALAMPVRRVTFTTEEAAKVLGRNHQVLYRWLQSELFPPPSLRARNDANRLQSVYSLNEMRALVNVFGEHQERTKYFRAEHQETRDRLFAAVAAVRAKWKDEYGSDLTAAAPAAGSAA